MNILRLYNVLSNHQFCPICDKKLKVKVNNYDVDLNQYLSQSIFINENCDNIKLVINYIEAEPSIEVDISLFCISLFCLCKYNYIIFYDKSNPTLFATERYYIDNYAIYNHIDFNNLLENTSYIIKNSVILLKIPIIDFNLKNLDQTLSKIKTLLSFS